MEALSAIVGIVAIVVGLISFDLSAVLLGTDSRDRSFDGEREAFWTNSGAHGRQRGGPAGTSPHSGGDDHVYPLHLPRPRPRCPANRRGRSIPPGGGRPGRPPRGEPGPSAPR